MVSAVFIVLTGIPLIEMLILNAPAKINWFLNVVQRRYDGYHDIVSLMQCITLNDSLVMEYSDAVEVITDAGIPMKDNLVYKAAILMRESAGIKSGVRVTLKKEIPMAAGLGGGSSDAAAALMGLNRLWNLNLTRHELAKFGEVLGSDIPFFFHGPVSIVGGRGDIVFPVGLKRSYAVLLVKPPVDVSTAWAYAELDSGSSYQKVLTKETNNIKLFCQALERGDFSLLSSMQRNDLEPLVVRRYPIIGDIKHNLMMRDALFSSMSGSGPTVFGVFDSESKAVNAMEHMSPHWCRAVKTMTSS